MAGIPNIAGQIGIETTSEHNTGPFYRGTFTQLGWRGSSDVRGTNFDASRSSSIYGSSNTVTPLSISCKFLICY